MTSIINNNSLNITSIFSYITKKINKLFFRLFVAISTIFNTDFSFMNIEK